jgi:twitching motility protein PilT
MDSPDIIFQTANQANASDVHIAVGAPLTFRIDGVLTSQGEAVLSTEDVAQFVRDVIGDERMKELEETKEMDTAYCVSDGLRLRINCHVERGNHGLVARIIPMQIPSLEEIGMGDIGPKLCAYTEGLILFTGPTGSGKSTSMAAMIAHIAQERPSHVVTIEDPIEFLFPAMPPSVIRQRQYGSDFHSFPEAMKHVLRQDPNVILVGEMRDPETIASALTLAETGHLVFATLHTPNAVQTVDRIVDVFPAHQQNQIRSQLSMSLKAIVAQRLHPCVNGGRVASREVLVNTPAVANIIRENRIAELASALQTGREQGMCTFEQDEERLRAGGLIREGGKN